MNLCEEKTYESWVLRYGRWDCCGGGFETAEIAREHARSCGFDDDSVEVVIVKRKRALVDSQ